MDTDRQHRLPPLCLPVIAAGLLTLVVGASAREFRGFNPVPAPQARPDGAVAIEEVRPVEQQVVVEAVHRLMSTWNTPGLDKMLGEGFYDRSRLLDALATAAPRDARLRILAVQGIQTLDQFLKSDPESPSRPERVSRVLVTVRTQVEFNDPGQGLQTLVGTNEYILSIRQPAEPPRTGRQ